MSFDDTVEIRGETYDAWRLGVPEGLEDRYAETIIVRGAPAHTRDEMLRAAQLSETPHAWRVGDALTPDEVTPEVIERARTLFDRDVIEYGTVFLTFLAIDHDGGQTLIGCAAARRKIDPSYESEGWIVLSRLLAVPELRGLGFGRHFTFAFFAASQTMMGAPALGCFMPTETEQTRRLCKRAVQGGVLDLAEAGVKRWPVLDTVFEVDVYRAFYPGMREELEARASRARDGLDAGPVNALLDAAEAAWRDGYDAAGGARLGALFQQHGEALERLASERPELSGHLDFLRAARAMGTLEPI